MNKLIIVCSLVLFVGVSFAVPKVLANTLFTNFGTLSTCSATIEGGLEEDVLSGASTGKRTKLCLCTSDGSAAYKWQNVVTGTLGTTTTCGTE